MYQCWFLYERCSKFWNGKEDAPRVWSVRGSNLDAPWEIDHLVVQVRDVLGHELFLVVSIAQLPQSLETNLPYLQLPYLMNYLTFSYPTLWTTLPSVTLPYELPYFSYLWTTLPAVTLWTTVPSVSLWTYLSLPYELTYLQLPCELLYLQLPYFINYFTLFIITHKFFRNFA